MPTTTARRGSAAAAPKKASLAQRTAARMGQAAALAASIAKKQAQVTVLNRDIKAERDTLLSIVLKLKRKTLDVTGPDGELLHVVQAQGSSEWIDEAKLRKQLTAAQWNKVTRRVLDSALVEAAVANGDIDATVVAQCTESKLNAPYVKVTTKGTGQKETDK